MLIGTIAWKNHNVVCSHLNWNSVLLKLKGTIFALVFFFFFLGVCVCGNQLRTFQEIRQNFQAICLDFCRLNACCSELDLNIRTYFRVTLNASILGIKALLSYIEWSNGCGHGCGAEETECCLRVTLAWSCDDWTCQWLFKPATRWDCNFFIFIFLTPAPPEKKRFIWSEARFVVKCV